MMKKVLACLLCVLMTMGMLAGCGKGEDQSQNSKPAESGAGDSGTPGEEPYKARMIIALPAASPSEGEVSRMLEKLNELTLEKLNMTLDLQILPFAAYLEQIQLELSSKSDLDIFTSVSAYGPSWVNAGYVADMKPLLEEYGQDVLNSYASPEVAMSPSLNGYVYGVPVHKEISQQATVFFRTDILEKYNIDVSNIHSIEDVDALYAQVAEKEPDMWMIAPDNLGMPELSPLDYVGGLETYAIMDPANTTTVENFFATDTFKKWCTYVHKWFENGWVNSGAASDTESYYSYIKSGQAFSFFSDYGHPLSEIDQENNCGGVDLTMVQLAEPLATTATSAVFCYSIGSGSKDPAKAMQMLNFLMSSTEAMNLLNWGVEGEDYVVNADGLLDYPEGKDASTVGYHLGAGWILPNQFVCTPWSTDGADIYKKIEDYNASSIISKAMGFTFDPTPVQDQISAVSNVRAKYYKALITGAVDPEEYIPILLEEMQDAGSEDVIAEMQRQLDEWMAGR
ncbi:MAG: ABC transporter substrate-binding protein [Acetatifactor sp.]|nr:ABC transporter substrate-binding protein [Acetatifactor sp.]